jgi:uncharacterized protein
MLIEMKVRGMAVDPLTEMPILILKDVNEEISLPIWIGLVEAGAIVSELESIELSRPMTHDLIKNLLVEMGAQLLHVEITDLREHTYFASLLVQHGTRVVEVDARPSDAIALALRAKCPIRVNESVVCKAREIDLRARLPQSHALDSEAIKDLLSNIPDEDFGKWKM